MDVVREALNFYKPCDPLHGFAHIGWSVQTP